MLLGLLGCFGWMVCGRIQAFPAEYCSKMYSVIRFNSQRLSFCGLSVWFTSIYTALQISVLYNHPITSCRTGTRWLRGLPLWCPTCQFVSSSMFLVTRGITCRYWFGSPQGKLLTKLVDQISPVSRFCLRGSSQKHLVAQVCWSNKCNLCLNCCPLVKHAFSRQWSCLLSIVAQRVSPVTFPL